MPKENLRRWNWLCKLLLDLMNPKRPCLVIQNNHGMQTFHGETLPMDAQAPQQDVAIDNQDQQAPWDLETQEALNLYVSSFIAWVSVYIKLWFERVVMHICFAGIYGSLTWVIILV